MRISFSVRGLAGYTIVCQHERSDPYNRVVGGPSGISNELGSRVIAKGNLHAAGSSTPSESSRIHNFSKSSQRCKQDLLSSYACSTVGPNSSHLSTNSTTFPKPTVLSKLLCTFTSALSLTNL